MFEYNEVFEDAKDPHKLDGELWYQDLFGVVKFEVLIVWGGGV